MPLHDALKYYILVNKTWFLALNKQQKNYFLFKVDVKKDSVKVWTKDGRVLLEGTLFDQIKSNETVWNLTPGKESSIPRI